MNEAIEIAVDKLKKLDAPLKLNGNIRVFGRDMRLDDQEFTLEATDGGKPVKPADRLLVLHYLLHMFRDELLCSKQYFHLGQVES